MKGNMFNTVRVDWPREGGSEEKIEGNAGSSKDVKILFGSDSILFFLYRAKS